jgi:hypothetical protein
MAYKPESNYYIEHIEVKCTESGCGFIVEKDTKTQARKTAKEHVWHTKHEVNVNIRSTETFSLDNN